MSETKFNGPWTLRTMEQHSGRNDGIEIIDTKGDTVADNQTYYPQELNPAYAPLIAAAPELYEALDEMISGFRVTLQEHKQHINAAWLDGAERDIQNAVEVLAKARGERP